MLGLMQAYLDLLLYVCRSFYFLSGWEILWWEFTFVCLSACISLKPHSGTSPYFVLVACGGVAIRYVLPVLWMMTYFHIIGSMTRRVHAYNSDAGRKTEQSATSKCILQSTI